MNSEPESKQTDKITLRDVALVCLGGLLFAREDVKPSGPEQSYLFQQYHPLRHIVDPKSTLEGCLAEPATPDALLARLSHLLNLTAVEVAALVFALLVEEEAMIGRVLAHVQAPVGGSRPTLGMLEAALAPLADEPGTWLTGGLLTGAAMVSGVLQVVHEQAPLPEQAVKVPTGLVLALRGHSLVWPGAVLPVAKEKVSLPESTREMASRQVRSLERDPDGVLVIRAASRWEGRSVATEVAAGFGCQALFLDPVSVDTRGLGAFCRLTGRVPVFEYVDEGGEHPPLPVLPAYGGPCLVLTGPDGGVKVSRGSVLHWSLTPPTRKERRQLWSACLTDAALAERLARDHIHSAGRIAELEQLARREAELAGRDEPELADISRATWEAEAGVLGGLAQPMSVGIADEALVVSRSLGQELERLVARCRARENLDVNLGVTIKARYQQGVRCLLVGPSGTGKTLAAGWLATKLGLPLYRVDLAAVMSKYVGETEKNLSVLLARAEHSEIVLLFDEADSLFGKRTDIRDSNDRFANSQTNYLLQRIEFYRGIVLLTSNSRERFDSAFTRRLDRIIEFTLPSPPERRALWFAHLGPNQRLGIRQINQLAAVCDLAGGHIRNAVLAAAVEAEDRQRPISYEDILIGLDAEYRKLGRQFPAELRRVP